MDEDAGRSVPMVEGDAGAAAAVEDDSDKRIRLDAGAAATSVVVPNLQHKKPKGKARRTQSSEPAQSTSKKARQRKPRKDARKEALVHSTPMTASDRPTPLQISAAVGFARNVDSNWAADKDDYVHMRPVASVPRW